MPVAEWNTDRLTKEDFLTENNVSISGVLREVNQGAAKLFPANSIAGDQIPVTIDDFYLLFYSESGLTDDGFVNTYYQHSLKEQGLLPLVDNSRFWIAADVPTETRLPPRANIYNFFLYCAAIKNKDFKHDSLSRSLFTHDMSRDDPLMQARLLAGVVHGYFETYTYADDQVPLPYLLESYKNNVPLHQMHETTQYKNSSPEEKAKSQSVLESRHGNLVRAERLLGRLTA